MNISDIKCNKCGASYFIELYNTTTAVYYPPIYKNGVNINPDKNITTTVCRCCECNNIFSFQIQCSEIINI